MQRVLFISNGHGEIAIAHRIARATRVAAQGRPLGLDHLALVGRGGAGDELALVGPRRTMPSGGLVAMGNVRAFAGDLAAGFAGHFSEQVVFAAAKGRRYDLAVAIGDVYALLFALLGAGRAPLYVGTAKSVYVAPYGPFERVLLRRAARIFVRDESTAAHLRARGVPAEAPGNVIVDMALDGAAAAESPAANATAHIGILPGSRQSAYLDGLRLARVVRAAAAGGLALRATFSIAPALSAERFAAILRTDGWEIVVPSPADVASDAPAFVARAGGATLEGRRGVVGALLAGCDVAAGQAGTANEEAAALGVPIVALGAANPDGRREGWYRMRQRRLLGEALAILPSEPEAAAVELATLLRSPERLAAMRRTGRERMGPAGGAAAIAAAIVDALDERLR